MNNYNGNKVYSADPAGYYAVLGVASESGEQGVGVGVGVGVGY